MSERYNKVEESTATLELDPRTLPPNYDQAVYPNLPNIQTVQPVSEPEQIQQPQVIIQNVNIPVGERSSRITCPSCRSVVGTKIEFSSSTRTHLIALLLCLGGCCCFAPIPYFVDSCRNVNHSCPACGTFIGTYKR